MSESMMASLENLEQISVELICGQCECWGQFRVLSGRADPCRRSPTMDLVATPK